MTEHLIFLSVPGLRLGDVDREKTPTLHGWAHDGAFARLQPTFPCVTSCVQASMWTGAPPGQHGVIANGCYHRDRREVEFWVGRNGVIAGEQVWNAIRAKQPEFTSAAWHAQNIKDAGADFIVTPAPIHEPDGSMKLWCYSKPDGLYEEMLGQLGHFPLQHYWGPMAGIESTRWILRAAYWLLEEQAPNFHWIYLPQLDYASQMYGPNSIESRAALIELDLELAEFAADVANGPLGEDVVYLAAGEYAMTDVSGVVYPNRMLRKAGLLKTREEGGCEHIDFERSTAFAMVDHQLAHIYVSDPSAVAKVRELFRGTNGVAGVYAGDERSEVGLDHKRSGEVILIAGDTHWMAYYWWFDDAAAPAFARTVDIHRKPGYDPVELFFDPATKGISLDATLVKGSHGAPVSESKHETALICSADTPSMPSGRTYRDTDVKDLVLGLLDCEG